MAPIDPKTTADERSAVLQRRVQEFTKLYESEAYRAYNLALRIACEPERARAAAEQAFLSAAEEKDPPAALTPAVVRNALAEARRKPKASGAGGAEAQRLLDAVAKLPASERAAVILAAVERFDSAKIAAALEIPPASAAHLLERGDEQLGRELSVASSQLPALLASWPWAEPPPQLWEGLYTRFYAAAQRQLDTTPGTARRPAAAASGRATRRSRQSARRTSSAPAAGAAGVGLLSRLRGLSWRTRLAAIGVIAVSAAAFAMVGGDDAGDAATLADQFGASGVDATGAPYSGADGGSAGDDGEEEEYEPLTPEELDELRRKEIKDLKRYQKKQSDSSLSDEVRERAAAKAQSLLQKQRGGRSGSGSGTKKQSSGGNKSSGGGGNKSSGGSKTTPKPAPDPEPAPKPKPKPPPDDTSGGDGSKDNDSGSKDKPKSDDEKSDCLYDEAKQSYICPQ